MFIIGNAGLMSKERHEKWPKIIEELRRNDRLGEGLPIVCQNHPNVTNIISDPETFKIMAPNGGCLAPCGRVMPCGHTCPLSCKFIWIWIAIMNSCDTVDNGDKNSSKDPIVRS
jgi:hypothetical protein